MYRTRGSWVVSQPVVSQHRGQQVADEPRDDDRGEPTLMALRRTAYRRALIEGELVEVVGRAREAGASWTKIGKELGTSGEAARQRYADRIDA